MQAKGGQSINLDEDMLSVSDGFPEIEHTPKNRGTREEESHHTGATPEPKRTRQEEEDKDKPPSPPPGLAGSQPRGSQDDFSPNLTAPTQATPAQPETPPENLTLADLFKHMQSGFQTVGQQVTSMKTEIRSEIGRDLNRIRNEQKETNNIAAKALTTADQTKQELKTLAQRVEKLEKGEGPPGTNPRTHPHFTGGKGKGKQATGYEQLGGEQGNEIIMGQIPHWASQEERLAIWQQMKERLAPELSEQVTDVVAPGLRQCFLRITLQPHPEGISETRKNMLSFCRKVKEAAPTYTGEDGSEIPIFATPSKPWQQRQRDAAATLKADVLKRLLGEEKAAQFQFEIGKGRAFLGRDLLTERASFDGEVEYIMGAIRKHIPDITAEKLKETEETIREERARKNHTK